MTGANEHRRIAIEVGSCEEKVSLRLRPGQVCCLGTNPENDHIVAALRRFRIDGFWPGIAKEDEALAPHRIDRVSAQPSLRVTPGSADASS